VERGHIFTNAEVHDLVLCSKSVHAFVQRCSIAHPMKGSIAFEPYVFQDVALHHVGAHRLSIILKSRQMGISTTIALYALWVAMFERDQTIVFAPTRLSAGMDLLDRIRFAIDALPPYLRPTLTVRNKTTLEFDNGSRMLIRTPNTNMCRGMGVNLMIFDELAYVGDSQAQDMWTANYPMISTGTQVIVQSSAGRDTGLFYELWTGATTNVGSDGVGQNGFAGMEIPWWRHPDRDQVWAQPFIDQLGQDWFDNEFNCQFKAA
jgi:hypothetical protein